MRSKFICLLLCLCLMIPAGAEARELPAANDVLSALAEKAGYDSIQNWIDRYLSISVGAGSENVILAAAVLHPELDFSSYEASALEVLNDEGSRLSAATKQYIIHVLFCLGHEPGALSVYVPDAPQEQGIMSLIYAIHLADDGIIPDGDLLRTKLLSLCLPDGGWAIFGENSDVDVTAMALQALPGNEFQNAAWEDFGRLSSMQLEDGGFKSFGEENCESLAQVIMALVSRGMHPESEASFIKNENTPTDALKKFALDGLFTHSLGGEYSFSASAQAMLALLSLEKGLSVWELRREAHSTPSSSFYRPESSAAYNTSSAQNNGTYKLPAVLCVCAAAVLLCVLLIIFRKRNIKNFLFIAAVAVLIITAILLTNITSVDEYYKDEKITSEKTGTVTLSINCEKLVGKTDLSACEDGVILSPTTFAIYENDTVYDLLVRAAKEKHIRLDLRGGYVAGIESVYELKFGELSGWIYHVNGIEAKYGCREYRLSDGDVVEWLYTLELGKDLLQNETA